jgi:hypothetical protein
MLGVPRALCSARRSYPAQYPTFRMGTEDTLFVDRVFWYGTLCAAPGGRPRRISSLALVEGHYLPPVVVRNQGRLSGVNHAKNVVSRVYNDMYIMNGTQWEWCGDCRPMQGACYGQHDVGGLRCVESTSVSCLSFTRCAPPALIQRVLMLMGLDNSYAPLHSCTTHLVRKKTHRYAQTIDSSADLSAQVKGAPSVTMLCACGSPRPRAGRARVVCSRLAVHEVHS